MLLSGTLINPQARTAQVGDNGDCEELCDNELIDEIEDEVLLDLEEERPDETYDGEVDQWAEACQAELAQLLELSRSSPSSHDPDGACFATALPPSWDQVRDLLNQFFQKRVYGKTKLIVARTRKHVTQ